MAMLNAAVSCGTVENKKFASCFLNQHRFLGSHSTRPSNWTGNHELSSSHLLSSRKGHHRTVPHTRGGCGTGPASPCQEHHCRASTPAAWLQWLQQNLHHSWLRFFIKKWNKLMNLLFFGKAYFMHQNKNLHFAAPKFFFLSADLP